MKNNNNKYGIYILFLTITIDMIGIGIIFPVLPQLLQTIGKFEISEAAKIGGLMVASYSFMQFIMSPVMGNLSDAYGRRKVILLSTLGYSLDWLIMAFTHTIFLLFIGRMISGAFAAIYSTAMAYISDVIEPEKRGGYFGLLGAGFGIGFTFGPMLGGWLGEYGARIPFFVASILSIANFFLVLFLFPESLPKAKRRKFKFTRANPLSSLIEMSKFKGLIPCFMIYFFYQSSHQLLPAIWAYFTTEKFAWTTINIGFSLTLVGITASIVQGGLVKLFLKYLGNWGSVILGVSIFMVSLMLFAFLASERLIYIILFISAIAGITTPALQAIMTKNVPANQQGELQGAIASLMSLTLLSSSIWATQIFRVFSDNKGIYFPGAPFIIGSLLALIALIFALKTKSKIS